MPPVPIATFLAGSLLTLLLPGRAPDRARGVVLVLFLQARARDGRSDRTRHDDGCGQSAAECSVRDQPAGARGVMEVRCRYTVAIATRDAAPPSSARPRRLALILGLGVGFVLSALPSALGFTSCLHGRPPPPLPPARRAPPTSMGRRRGPQARARRPRSAPCAIRAAGCSRCFAARPDGRDRVPRLPLYAGVPARGSRTGGGRGRAAARTATDARGNQRQSARHAGQRAGGAAQVGPGADRGLALADRRTRRGFRPCGGPITSSCTRRRTVTLSTPNHCCCSTGMATSARATCTRSSRGSVAHDLRVLAKERPA